VLLGGFRILAPSSFVRPKALSSFLLPFLWLGEREPSGSTPRGR